MRYPSINCLFKFYPYKKILKGDKNKTQIFKKDCVEHHKYSLNKKEWQEIVINYYLELLNYMANGYTYNFKNKLGSLSIVKTLPGNRRRMFNSENRNKRDTGPIRKYNIELYWHKGSSQNSFVKYWKIRINRKLFKPLLVFLNEKGNIYKIKERIK